MKRLIILVTTLTITQLCLASTEWLSIQEMIREGAIPAISNDTLDLSDRDIYSLEGFMKIPGVKKVKYLRLHKNHLQTFLQHDLDLPELVDLTLNDNKLKELPLLDFPLLEGLDLSDNQLNELPSANLPLLNALSLENNPLTDNITDREKEFIEELFPNADIDF